MPVVDGVLGAIVTEGLNERLNECVLESFDFRRGNLAKSLIDIYHPPYEASDSLSPLDRAVQVLMEPACDGAVCD